MPVPLTHFAVGATGMTILAVFPLRLRARSTAIILSGLWALVPDLYAVAPPYTSGLRVFHDSVVANFFWFAVGGWVAITLLIDLVTVFWTEFDSSSVSLEYT